MASVPDFEAGHTLVAQIAKPVVEPIQTGMSNHSETAGAVDVADGFGRAHPVTLDVTGLAAFKKSFERFFDAADNLATHECHRDVRTTNRAAVRTFCDIGKREFDTEFVEFDHKLFGALLPDLLRMIEHGVEERSFRASPNK